MWAFVFDFLAANMLLNIHYMIYKRFMAHCISGYSHSQWALNANNSVSASQVKKSGRYRRWRRRKHEIWNYYHAHKTPMEYHHRNRTVIVVSNLQIDLFYWLCWVTSNNCVYQRHYSTIPTISLHRSWAGKVSRPTFGSHLKVPLLPSTCVWNSVSGTIIRGISRSGTSGIVSSQHQTPNKFHAHFLILQCSQRELLRWWLRLPMNQPHAAST